MKSPEIDCLTGEMTNAVSYEVVFFFGDGLFIIMIIIIIFFLDVKKEKPSQEKISAKEEFGWVVNPAAMGFYLLVFYVGICWGAIDSFTAVYIDEEYGVPKYFVGKARQQITDKLYFCPVYLY